MRYQKFKADYLFTGENLLSHKNVLITDVKGNIINTVNAKDAGEEIENFKHDEVNLLATGI